MLFYTRTKRFRLVKKQITQRIKPDKVEPTSASSESRKHAPHARVVEPVGKPPERHFLALSGGDVFSLMPIRIAVSMILGPDDGLYLT